MSKNKSFLCAVGIPLLYMLLQSSVMSMLGVYASFSLMESLSTEVTYSELMEILLQKMLDIAVQYQSIILIVSGAIFIGISLLIYRRKTPTLWAAVRLNKKVAGSTLVLAALAGFGLNLFSSALMTSIPLPEDLLEAYEASMAALLGGSLPLTLLTTVLFVPFVEELIFRGFSQRLLEHASGRWTAVVLQALIFGIFHTTAIQSVYTMLMGLTAGILYLWSRNLWTTVLFHIVYNGTSFVLSGVLTAIYGEESLPTLLLAILAAFGMTLVIFCIRQLAKRFAKPRVNLGV